jgi:dihydrofolate reductase
MRKLIASEFMSLDGYFSGPGEEMDWVMNIFDEEIEAAILSEQVGIDTLILGRKTYQKFSRDWPDLTADDNPAADHMNKSTKVVFSRTLKEVSWGKWNNATLAGGEFSDEIQKMKSLPGKDMNIIGSGSLVRQFAQCGLIDEYRLMIFPVILGQGIPLFGDTRGPLRRQLLSAHSYKSGVVGLHYR